MSYFIIALALAITAEAFGLHALLRSACSSNERRNITLVVPLTITAAAYLAIWLSPVRALGDGGLDPFLWFAHANAVLTLVMLAGALIAGHLYGKTPASS